MKILFKLLIPFLFISLLVSVVAYFGLDEANSIGTAYNEVGEETIPVIEALEDIRFAGMRIVTSTHEYYSILSEKKSRPLKEIELAKTMNGIELYDDSFRRYEELINEFFHDEKEQVDKLRISGEKLKETSSELINMTEQNVSVDQVLEKYGEFEYAEVYFLNEIDEALKNEKIEFNERNENVVSRIADSKMIILIISFSTFFIAIAVGVIVTRSVSNPIDSLKNAAEEINMGNLDTRVDIRTNDEMGVLANTFNKMVRNLSENFTENKQTVEHLEKNNEFVNTVLESLSYPFYVINVNDYTIALANSAARKKDFAGGSTCYELTHKNDKPCGTDGHICPLEEVKRTKKPVVVEHLHYDKDGNVRNMEVHCYPIFNGNGNVVQVIEYSLDITERKRSEEALAESEAKFRTVFDNVTDGIMLADIETKKQYMANKMMSRMLGYSLEEIKNLYISDIHPVKDLPWIIEVFEKQTRGEITLAENIPVKRKDGTVIYADINTSQVNIAGKTYNIGIFRDVTERRRNEETRRENERLALVNRAQSEFLMVMSHELRTPLNSIIGFSELLMKKEAGDMNETQQRYAGNVNKSGIQLLRIIDDILDLTRIQSGKLELSIEHLSVPVAVNDVLEGLKEKTGNQNVIIKKDLKPEIEFIDTDGQKFRQVLNNLLDNAVKFSKPEGGTVTITAEKEGDMAKFSVADMGIGIKEEDMGKLFHSFEQLDAGISRKYGGTGLELAVSKKTVELIGGSITVESKYGEGSTFTFYLPLVSKKEEEVK